MVEAVAAFVGPFVASGPNSTDSGFAVAYLSNAMKMKLSEWSERGYEVVSASVRFIVAWKPKDAPAEESESAVLLADLSLKRKN